MSEEVELELKQEEWIYAGQRVHKGKRYYCWSKNKDDSNDLSYYLKPLVPASVGSTHLFTTTTESVYTSGKHMPKYIGRCQNNELVTQWAIADESAKQQLATKSMNTKVSKEYALDEFFASLKKASRNLNSTERLALIAKASDIILKA